MIQQGDDLQILLVDDSRISQELSRDFLENLGFLVETVNNGLKAVEKAKQNSYSLIFMDVQAPVMNGLAAAREIRKYEKLHQLDPVTIIALSAESSDNIMELCNNAGINDVMLKPFTHLDIRNKTQQWVNNTKYINDTHINTAIELLSGQTNSQPGESSGNFSQLNHWSWNFSNKKIEFSADLHKHLDLNLNNITTMDEYIFSLGGDELKKIIDNCITEKCEARWEQKIVSDNIENTKYLLHKFRVIISNNRCPVLIGTVQDVTNIRLAEEKNIKLASYDFITGMSSRLHLNHHIEDLIKRQNINQDQFAILFFKVNLVNAYKTSDVGISDDSALMKFSSHINVLLRKQDLACRLIENEFCIVIDHTIQTNSLSEVVNRYITLISEKLNTTTKNNNQYVRLGLSKYPQDGNKATDLLEVAKYSSYEVTIHNPVNKKIKTSIIDNNKIDSELRDALDTHRLELYYKPNISFRSQTVVSVDARVHFNDTNPKLLTPDCLIKSDQCSDLIANVGQWCIIKACKQLMEWRERRIFYIPISLSVPLRYFEQSSFIDDVVNITNEYKISPTLIDININEGAIRNYSNFISTCQKLRSRGFKVAVDDFGSGYTTMSVLKDLPVDEIKIHRDYIRYLPNDIQSSIILGTILGITNRHHINIVAKGIENTKQVQMLSAIGCNLAQGDHLSHWVSAYDVPALISHDTLKPRIYRMV